MSVQRCEGLTLRTYPYGESHKIVVFLTRELGQLRGIAHGARKSQSRFGGSLEPLTYSRITFSRKEHQELAVIQGCEILKAFPPYRLSWEENLHVSYFCELLGEFSREEQEASALVRLALAVMESMGKVPVGLLARYFEYWLLHLEGVLPALQEKLPPALASRWLGELKNPPSQLQAGRFSREELSLLERVAEQLIEYHLERRLKTRKLLKELTGLEE